MSAINQQITRIHSKLELVRKQNLRCFGSDIHHFLLNAPLDQSEILQFERQHGIALPEDYREFMTRLGNGGAGPYYGILPLDRWHEAVYIEPDDFPIGYLSNPCPLHPDLEFSSERWEERVGISEERLFQGTMAIAHQGCAYYCLLIVSGKARGRVIYVDLVLAAPPYFVENDSFLSWYERWLDELLAGYDISWFGFGMPGTESQLISALSNAESSRRADAAKSIMRLPSLSMEGVAALKSAIKDMDAGLRAAAVVPLGRYGGIEALADTYALLNDPEPKVRLALIRAFRQIPSDAWHDPIRVLLSDSSSEVIQAALRALEAANALKSEDLQPLFDHRDEDVRRTTVYLMGEIGASDVKGLIETALDDPDDLVRVYAVQALGKQPNASVVSKLLKRFKVEQDSTVIANIIQVLEEISDKAAVPALIEATRHTDPFVRLDAARALGKIGDLSATDALKALLEDTTKPAEYDQNGLLRQSHTFRVCDVAKEALKSLNS